MLCLSGPSCCFFIWLPLALTSNSILKCPMHQLCDLATPTNKLSAVRVSNFLSGWASRGGCSVIGYVGLVAFDLYHPGVFARASSSGGEIEMVSGASQRTVVCSLVYTRARSQFCEVRVCRVCRVFITLSADVRCFFGF